jgi:hypothetical protein
MEEKLVVGTFGEYPIEAVCTVSNDDILVACKGVIGSYKQARAFLNRYNHREINYFGFLDQRSEIKDSILDSNKVNIACLEGTRTQLEDAVKKCETLLHNNQLTIPGFETYETAIEYSNQFKNNF